MTKTLSDLPMVDAPDGDMPSLDQQARWAREHAPIYKRVITGDGPGVGDYVFMVGPEANRFVLHGGRKHFSHDLGWTPLIGEDLGRGLLNMDDPVHEVHRRMWNPAFSAAAMEAYLPVIQRVIAERTRRWPEHEAVDTYNESRTITFDAAAAALAGFEPGEQVDRLRELFNVLMHGFDPARESMEEFTARARQARTDLMQILLKLVYERRALPVGAHTRDVLGAIVHALDENGNPLSDEQLLGHLNILLVAGHETTTTLAAWALYLLSIMPEQRALLREELRAVAGNEQETVGVEALRRTPRLDNFIKEVGRMYSPVVNVPRGVLSDFEFGGYAIPAGTRVRLALAAGHRLPQVFSDPDRFDPERFAAPREEDKRNPYGLVTFGGGTRICIGINFANIEVKALLAHVLRRYELERVPDQEIVYRGYWTAFVANGLKVRAR